MPETLKFKKKSKVRTWFRETVAVDYFPLSELSVVNQQQGRAATSVTVKPFQGYLTLPSNKSDTELDMAENEASNANPMEVMMRELQQMKLKTRN